MRLARHPEVRYALLAVVATSVLAALVLRLWDATLGIPFLPGGDGYLGAPFGQNLHD